MNLAASSLAPVVVREADRRQEEHPRIDVPKHIGVILDGNRRWARASKKDLCAGYERGGEQVRQFLRWCKKAGIQYVTLWALSVDNLQRSEEEIAPLVFTIQKTIEQLVSDRNWRIRLIGSSELLSPVLSARLQRLVEGTEALAGPTVNIAVAYDGRREILDAVRKMLSAESGRQLLSALSEEELARHLYTKGQPDPELVIRTSGEQRLSGFLTWQCAYSEFYFCDVPWPAFTEAHFIHALNEFNARHRRFGM